MIAGKVWGTTELLLRTPVVELHRLWIEANAQCSMHVHQFKWNTFYVIEGVLEIEVEKRDYDLTDITKLGPGAIMSVKPGEYHRFRSKDAPCIALEIYHLEPLSEDIIRKDHGMLRSVQNGRG